eukprot:6682744-Prymnesium_polylepis.1
MQRPSRARQLPEAAAAVRRARPGAAGRRGLLVLAGGVARSAVRGLRHVVQPAGAGGTGRVAAGGAGAPADQSALSARQPAARPRVRRRLGRGLHGAHGHPLAEPPQGKRRWRRRRRRRWRR